MYNHSIILYDLIFLFAAKSFTQIVSDKTKPVKGKFRPGVLTRSVENAFFWAFTIPALSSDITVHLNPFHY